MSGSVALSHSVDVGARLNPDPRVAAFVGFSTTAWPGRSSAAILVSGCDMRCPYCHCPEMLYGNQPGLGVDQVIDRVAGNRCDLDGIVITGGEPTAHPGITDLLRRLKALSIPVKMDTNGSFPGVLSALISDELISFVALDVKAVPERYDSATGSRDAWERVRRSIAVVLDSGIDHEFRTTCYPSALQTADLPRIASELEGGRRYVIQQFRPQRTLDPAASSVRPYDAESLRRAALCCAVHLPTVVRGV